MRDKNEGVEEEEEYRHPYIINIWMGLCCCIYIFPKRLRVPKVESVDCS